MARQYEKTSTFPPDKQDMLEESLRRIQQFVSGFTWEWVKTNNGNVDLVLHNMPNLEDSPEVTIAHWRTARAVVDFFLSGYNLGYEHGREDESRSYNDSGV